MSNDPLQFPVKKSYYFDPIPTADYLEQMLHDVLLPHKPGIYHPFTDKLMVEFGKDYFQPDPGVPHRLRKFVPLSFEDITTDIYLNDQRILPIFVFNAQPDLYRMQFPSRGIRLIRDYFDSVILGHAAWEDRFAADNYEAVWDRSFREGLSEHERQQAHSKLLEVINPHRQELDAFLGTQDDDHWVMHFLKVEGTDFKVEKSIDYRIYDWYRMKRKAGFPIHKVREHS